MMKAPGNVRTTMRFKIRMVENPIVSKSQLAWGTGTQICDEGTLRRVHDYVSCVQRSS